MTDIPLYFLLFISISYGKNLFSMRDLHQHALEKLGNARSAKFYTSIETKFSKTVFLSKGSQQQMAANFSETCKSSDVISKVPKT